MTNRDYLTNEELKRFSAEAYKRFPDQTEEVEYEGRRISKIVVDRGSLRYAFLEGVRYALSEPAAASPESPR